MSIKIIETADHSHSLFHETLNEKYHSLDGAWTESMYVYIDKGLLYKTNFQKNNTLYIFEMGFGTGLNAFQTLITSENLHYTIYYHSVEKYPLQADITSKLNYTQFTEKKYTSYFQNLHTVEWEIWNLLSPRFHFKKTQGDINTLNLSPNSIDLVYFDAFAPNKQPEVWSQSVFDKLYNAMSVQGVLVTYCAQGAFKRSLKQSGFDVERLPGPPGKREMTRAVKVY